MIHMYCVFWLNECRVITVLLRKESTTLGIRFFEGRLEPDFLWGNYDILISICLVVPSSAGKLE